VDAGEVREAGVAASVICSAHVQRVDAAEVREAGVGDLLAGSCPARGCR
jgi:hypothetical protein